MQPTHPQPPLKQSIRIFKIVFFWWAVLLLLMLASCQKEQQTELAPITDVQSQPKYKLSLSIPLMNVNSIDVPDEKILDLEQPPIGNMIYFTDDVISISVIRLFDGSNHIHLGAINGKPFGIVNDSLNFCNGPQRVPFTYKLE